MAITFQELLLARPECRIELHFMPAYRPHLDLIERLWGLTHKHITHSRRYERVGNFLNAFLPFLREDVPRNWRIYHDTVSDNSASSRQRILGFCVSAV